MAVYPQEPTMNDYQWLLLTMALTIACSWALQEILERKFNLFPNIITAKQVESMALINKRLTKSLDINGRYRIQTRGSTQFIKCLWSMILFVVSIVIKVTNPQWFMDHFINLKEETVHYVPYLHISASIVGFYSWEVVSNRYGKLQWSVLFHHWFTVGIAIAILFGRYSPFATWYGFCLISMAFPMNFSLGFRSHFSHKYPALTRKLFRFSHYLFVSDIVICLSGQIYIIINSLVFHYNESIHVGFIAVTIILICGWVYDDIVLVKALKAFSLQNYEDADVLNNDDAAKVEHMELEIIPNKQTKLMRIVTTSTTPITPTTTMPDTPTTPNTPITPASIDDETCTL